MQRKPILLAQGFQTVAVQGEKVRIAIMNGYTALGIPITEAVG